MLLHVKLQPVLEKSSLSINSGIAEQILAKKFSEEVYF